MSLTYEEDSNTEQGLVSEPSVDAARRSSKRVLLIGGLVALGLVVAGGAVILRNKPQPEVLTNVDGSVALDGQHDHRMACDDPDGGWLSYDSTVSQTTQQRCPGTFPTVNIGADCATDPCTGWDHKFCCTGSPKEPCGNDGLPAEQQNGHDKYDITDCTTHHWQTHSDSMCRVSCGAGFTGTTNYYSCGNSPGWTGSPPSCALENCDSKYAPTGPTGAGVISDCVNKAVGDTCTAKCADGFINVGGQDEEFKCKANKKYEGTSPTCEEVTCKGYTCPEGLIKLLGSNALRQPLPNDAKCCAVCPRGWTQLGKTGAEAPGWGLSEVGTVSNSLSTCANSCKDNVDCVSFKWHPTTKNCIHMPASASTEEAQTSKWDNVVTCAEATCATTGKSTAGVEEGIPCVFPFRYKGSVYNECTHDGHNNMNPGGSQLNDAKLTTWCATETQDMEAVPEKWGHCSAGCDASATFVAAVEGVETVESLAGDAGVAPAAGAAPAAPAADAADAAPAADAVDAAPAADAAPVAP